MREETADRDDVCHDLRTLETDKTPLSITQMM
jgi:hypothetical protein